MRVQGGVCLESKKVAGGEVLFTGGKEYGNFVRKKGEAIRYSSVHLGRKGGRFLPGGVNGSALHRQLGGGDRKGIQKRRLGPLRHGWY